MVGNPIEQHGEYNCGTGMYGMRATDNISICEQMTLSQWLQKLALVNLQTE